jgi:hypothetical protein
MGLCLEMCKLWEINRKMRGKSINVRKNEGKEDQGWEIKLPGLNFRILCYGWSPLVSSAVSISTNNVLFLRYFEFCLGKLLADWSFTE